MTDPILAGKTLLVTGAANGIGRTIAALAAQHGARAVIAMDLQAAPREGSSVESLVCGHGAEYRFFRGDITDAAALSAAVQLAEPFGGLDVMVCNAGMAVANDTLDIDLQQWARLIDVNLKGVFLSARAGAQGMIARRSGGSIVIIASMGGVRGGGKTVTYSATKGGARLYAQSLAAALGPHDIRVNAVCPGVIDTGFAPSDPEFIADLDKLRVRTPLGRSGSAADVAGAVVWLGSDLARFVTGASIVVDGGLTAVL